MEPFTRKRVYDQTIEFDFILRSGKRVKLFQLPVFKETVFFTDQHGALFIQCCSEKIYTIQRDGAIKTKEEFVNAVYMYRTGMSRSE
jgi:hypothetical protein